LTAISQGKTLDNGSVRLIVNGVNMTSHADQTDYTLPTDF
jgi:hypothetical protein